MSPIQWTIEMRQAAKLLRYDLDIRHAERQTIFNNLFGCDATTQSVYAMAGESRKQPGAARRSPDWDRINAAPQSAADQQMRARLIADIEKIQSGQWTPGEVSVSSSPTLDATNEPEEGVLEEHATDEATGAAGEDAPVEDETSMSGNESETNSPAQEESAAADSDASSSSPAESTDAITQAQAAQPTLESALPSIDHAKWLLENENGGEPIKLKFLHSVEILNFQQKLLYRRNRNLTQADRAVRGMPKTVGGVTFSAELTEIRQICVQSECQICQGEDGNSNGSLSPLTNEERHWLSTRDEIPSNFFPLANSGRLSFLTEDEQRDMREAMAAEEAEAMARLAI